MAIGPGVRFSTMPTACGLINSNGTYEHWDQNVDSINDELRRSITRIDKWAQWRGLEEAGHGPAERGTSGMKCSLVMRFQDWSSWKPWGAKSHIIWGKDHFYVDVFSHGRCSLCWVRGSVKIPKLPERRLTSGRCQHERITSFPLLTP